ncbi:MAG: class I SAM-dependent methyltransferase [Gemmatimonadota bacterium]
MVKRYEQAYFDKWYRDPRHRIESRTRLLREVTFVVAATEQLLQRPLKSVLDVGAGEGRWQPVLQRLRPGSRYAGVEPSEYAVQRWGRRRNLRSGSIDTLDTLGLDAPFDLVICADVLHYLPTATVRHALPSLASLAGGVIYLATFAGEDAIDGDHVEFQRRRAARYRALFREAGLVSVGLHLYLPQRLASDLSALERPG